MISPTLPTQSPPPHHAADIGRMRAAAVELEANFLAEMLKAAGLGETENGFSGGTGEAQFASFLRTEQARAMAHAGGIGLAEKIFTSLQGHRNA